MVGGFWGASFGEGVEGEGGVFEVLMIFSFCEVEFAQVFGDPRSELVEVVLEDGDAVFFGFEESEAAVGAGPEFWGIHAGPVGEAAGVGLHGEDVLGAAEDVFAGFVLLDEVWEEGLVFAEGEPGEDAAGGLFDATVGVLEDVLEGVAGFAES